MRNRDILDRLTDFDGHGGTATERFTMRMDAWSEIVKLRRELTEAKAARGELYRAMNESKIA
jgi:hypothetical protein